jgi:hypothetical protein
MAKKKAPGLVKRGQICHIDNWIGKKRIQSSTERRCLEKAEAILNQAYGQNGKAFPTLSDEACTIIPLNQWPKLVEILVRDGIPGRLEMPCSPELQDID